MKKHIISILIILCVITCLTGCAYTTYENVTFDERNGEQYVLYQGKEYYTTSLFTATEAYGQVNENDVELGYYYSFPFSTKFYSDSSENPVFIYSIGGDTNLYLRQDYDYKSDTYVVGDTSKTVVFAEVLTKSDCSYDDLQNHGEPIKLVISLKNHSNMKLSLQLVRKNNIWYVIDANKESYVVSQSFLDFLYEIDIIPSTN